MSVGGADESGAKRIENVNRDMATRDGIQFVFGGETLILQLPDNIDSTTERTRLTAAITAISKERDSLASRLNNPAFIEKAKSEAVEKARADHAEKSAEVDRLTAALSRLG